MPTSSDVGWKTPSMRGYSVLAGLPDEEDRLEACKELPALMRLFKKEESKLKVS